VRWRRPRSWAASADPEFGPNNAGREALHPPAAAATVIATDELGPVTLRTLEDPPPGWTPDGHRVKAPLTYSRGPEKIWIYGGCGSATGRR